MNVVPARLVDLAIVGFFAIFVYEARNWKLEARLYPWVVGIAMLVLAVAHLIRELARDGDERLPSPGSAPVDSRRATDLDGGRDQRRAFGVFAWSLGLLAGIWLIGFGSAVPLFLLLYLKAQSRETWGLSVVLAGVAGLAFWGLFDWFLHLPLPDGIVFSWLDPR